MQSAKFRYVPQRELSAFSKCEEVFFENTDMDPNAVNAPDYPFGIEQIKDAEARLVRFAPLIEKAFPETAPRHGIIESRLEAVPNYQKQLLKRGGCSEAVPAAPVYKSGFGTAGRRFGESARRYLRSAEAYRKACA